MNKLLLHVALVVGMYASAGVARADCDLPFDGDIGPADDTLRLGIAHSGGKAPWTESSSSWSEAMPPA